MKFRKKPIVIEAVQWTNSNPMEIEEFLFPLRNTGNRAYRDRERFIIPTLEGNMAANVGDWIIKGINGEFYPCKPDIFEKTYEPVNE